MALTEEEQETLDKLEESFRKERELPIYRQSSSAIDAMAANITEYKFKKMHGIFYYEFLEQNER
jgi:hypothetical protein